MGLFIPGDACPRKLVPNENFCVYSMFINAVHILICRNTTRLVLKALCVKDRLDDALLCDYSVLSSTSFLSECMDATSTVIGYRPNDEYTK